MKPLAPAQRVSLDGIECAYRRSGSGAPLVLVHGIPTSSRLWDAVGSELQGAADVIAPDLIGYGESAKPLDRDVSISAQADWLRELLDRLDVERAAVVGHDIGGGVAQIFAVRYGDRLTGLGLVDSVCFDSWPIPPMRALAAAAPAIGQLPAGWVTSALEPVVGREVPDEGRDALAASLAAWGDDREGLEAFLNNVRALDSRHTEEVAHQLERIDVPVQIIWGASDPFQKPEWAPRLRDAMPGATLKLLDGGHFLPWELPGEVAAEIRVLLGRLEAAA